MTREEIAQQLGEIALLRLESVVSR